MSSASAPVIVQQSSNHEKPKNIIDAISDIQRFSIAEKYNDLPTDFFTLENRIDMWVVGIKAVLTSFLISLILTPLSLGVLHQFIPVFGSTEQTLFDQIFSVYLMFAFPLAYGFLVAGLGKYYRGAVTKNIIRNLLSGIAAGVAIKIIASFVIYHLLYFSITPDLAPWLRDNIGTLLAPETISAVTTTLLEFKPIFVLSAWMTIISGGIFLGIPTVAIAYKHRQHTKHQSEFDF